MRRVLPEASSRAYRRRKATFPYKMKCNNIKAVAGLYKDYLANLQLAKRRLKNVDASSSSELQATATGANVAPDQRQTQDPQSLVLPPVTRPEIPVPQGGDSGLLDAEGSTAPDLGPSTSSNNDDIPSGDQGHLTGQDGDSNDQDDQVIPPRCNEDIEARP